MKNNHQPTGRMGWRGLWLSFAMVLGSIASYGQTVTIGTGTLTSSGQNGNPIYRSSGSSYYHHSKSIQLLTATQMSSAGILANSIITNFGYNKTAIGAPSAANGFTLNVYLKNSASTALASGTTWSSMISSASLVYTATINSSNMPNTAGYWMWNLQNPFIYTGGALECYIEWFPATTLTFPVTTGSFVWQRTATTSAQTMGEAKLNTIPGTQSSWNTFPFHYNTRITYIPPAPCSGTPTGGTANAASTNVCAGSPTSISVSGATAASGITYTWESSPDNTTWSTISGVTTPNYPNVVPAAAGTYYRRITTCTSSGLSAPSAATAKVDLNSFLNCYCASAATGTGDEEITNVTLGTINNTSVCASLTGTQGTATGSSDRYADYTASTVPVPNLNATQSYNLSFQLTLCNGSAYTNTNKVWIDWNRDGDFLDAGEEVFNSGALSRNTTTFNTSIFVPVWVTSGQTRMRVSTRETSANFDPCYNGGYGETEDYFVNLVAIPACSGTPNAGTGNPANANLCVGTGVNVSLTGATFASGIQYQWQESSDNSSWTNLSNAFALLYQNDFNTPNIGAAATYGNAAVSGGAVVLTPNATNQFGTLLIPGTRASSSQYQIDFDLNVSAAAGADGVSYSFGDDVNPNFDANMNAENGTGSKLKLGFVTYTNGSSTNGVYLMYNCTFNEQSSSTSGVLAYSSDISWRGANSHFTIAISTAGVVTVSMNGVAMAGLTNISLPASYLTELRQYWKHCFKARTGAITSIHAVDNFEVRADGIASGPSYNIVSYSGTPKYYRAVLTCNNSGLSDNSISSYIGGPGVPATQDSSFAITTAGTTSLAIAYAAAANVTGRVIKINTTNSFTDPVDGNYYTATGTAYAGSGEQTVFVGSGTGTLTVTGLNPNAGYWFRSYTYSDCGSGSVYYNTNNASQNPRRLFSASPDTMKITYTPSGVTYNSILTATGPVAGAVNPTWINTSSDDNTTNAITMPFPFNYHGQPVSGFRMCSNGWVSLESTTTSTEYRNNLNSGTPKAMIAPLWDDLAFLGSNFGNANASVAYKVDGTSPNRVLTMEWANFERLSSPSPNLNFQVKLYEGSDDIDIVYGNITPYTGAQSIAYTYSTGLNSYAATFGLKDVLALISPKSGRFSDVDPTNHTALPACYSSYHIEQGVNFVQGAAMADPGNDEPTGAINLDVSSSAGISNENCTRFITSGATWSAGFTAPTCAPSFTMGGATASGNRNGDRWYSFSLTGNPVQFGIDVASNNYCWPVFELYRNNGGGSYTYISCASATANGRIASWTSAGMTAGDYLIRAYHNNDTMYSSSLGFMAEYGLNVYAVIPPAFDSLGGANLVSITSSCSPTSTVYNTASSFASHQATTTAVTGLKDNWHVFQATASAGIGGVNVIVTPTVLQMNPKFEVYNLGSTIDTAAAIPANRIGTFDADGLGIAEAGKLAGLVTGNYYAIRVYHSAGGAGGASSYRVCVTPNLEYLNFNISKTAISTASYGSIANTGTSFTWGGAVSGDDELSDSVSLPFAFTYSGRPVTAIKVSTNGWVTLNAVGVSSSNLFNNLNSGSNSNAMVAPFWDDMVAPGDNAAGLITGFKYETKGTAPDRVFYIEFIGLEKYRYAGPSLNAQVRLYENGDRIDIVYGNSSFYDGTATSYTLGNYTYSMGLNGWGTGAMSGNQVVALGSVGAENFGSTDPTNLAGSMPCYTRYSFIPNSTTAYVAGPAEANITNDECATATVMPELTSSPTEWCSQYSLKGATASTSVVAAGPNATSNLARKFGRDVWFSFAAQANKKYAFDLRQGTGTNVGMAIYSSRTGCGSLTAAAHIYDGTGGSTQDTELVASQNQTYYIRVYQNDSNYTVPSGNNGYFNLVGILLPPPPVNDECSGAVRLTSSFAVPASLPVRSVIDATVTTTPTFCATAAADVWFSFRADYTTHTIRVSPVAPGVQFNPAIQVFSTGGTSFSCGSLTQIGCATSAAMNVQEVYSSTTFVPGQVYYVRVSNQTGGKGGTGNFSISLTHPDVRDISIENVFATVAGTGSGSAGTARNIRYVVKNNGPASYSGSGVTFSFSRNGTVLASTTPSLNLNVGDTTSVYFASTLTPTLNAIDTVKYYHSFVSDYVRSNDTVAINYNSTSSIMNFAWSRGYGNNLLDEGRAVATDASGNVISVGTYSNQAIIGSDTLKGDYRLGNADIMIIKSDSLGNAFWARTITGSNIENVRSVATDASGNVYVAGSFHGNMKAGNVSITSNGSTDGFVVKYSSAGVVQYAIKVGGSGAEVINDIKVNASNLYFVGGFSNSLTFGNSISSSGESDVMVGSMNISTGAANWVVKQGGYSFDMGNALTIDNNYIYTTGYFCNNRDISGPYNLASSGIFNMFVGKHNLSNGSMVWGRTLAGTGSEYGNGIALDASGDVIVSGTFNLHIDAPGSRVVSRMIPTRGAEDIFVTKFNAAGVYQWVYTMGGTGSDNFGKLATYNASNNIVGSGFYQNNAFFRGYSLNSTGLGDMFVYSADINGNTNWINRSSSSGSFAKSGSDVAVATSGAIYVTGTAAGTTTLGATSVTSLGQTDMFLTKLLTGVAGMQNGPQMREVLTSRVLPTSDMPEISSFQVDWLTNDLTLGSKEVTVRWFASQEIANSKFVIEQSVDGVNWTSIRTVKPVGGDQSYSVTFDRNVLVNAEVKVRVRLQTANGIYSNAPAHLVNNVRSTNELLINVYPNPANDVVTLQSSTSVSGMYVEVTSIEGKVVRRIEFNSNGNAADLNVSDLSNGVYLLNIHANNSVTTKKITVKH